MIFCENVFLRGCTIFFDKRLHDFFVVERLHDLCVERLRDDCVERFCDFLTHSQGCLIFFVEMLPDFFVKVA